jgi:hypothetical protein
MTDTTTVVTQQNKRVVEFVIMSGWILLIIVCFFSILAVCYLAIFRKDPISDPLQKLAFTSAGFLFGSFPTMVKDLLNAR